MKSGALLLSIFLLMALVPCPSHAQYAESYRDSVYPGYRTYNAYYINEMKAQILFEEKWGAIVYAPDYMDRFRLEKGITETLLHTGRGTVNIVRDLDGSFVITYPGGKCEVITGFGELTVRFKGQRYRFAYDGTLGLSRNSAVLELPDETISYERSFNEFIISGDQGEVRYKDGVDAYTINSPGGTTTYVRNLDGGYSLDGVSIESHPYRYWGICFYLSGYDFGIVVDFNKMLSFIRTPKIIEFKRAILVQ